MKQWNNEYKYAIFVNAMETETGDTINKAYIQFLNKIVKVEKEEDTVLVKIIFANDEYKKDLVFPWRLEPLTGKLLKLLV